MLKSDAPCFGNRRAPYRCCHAGGSLCGDCRHSAGPKRPSGAGFTNRFVVRDAFNGHMGTVDVTKF
jgi:hypothetical protein